MWWENFNKFGNKPALIETHSGTTTYHQLNKRIIDFSSALPEKKSLLLIACDNSTNPIIALYGALYGNHAVILVEQSNEDLKANLIQRYTPNFIYHRHNDNWILTHNNQKDLPLHNDLALLLSTSGTTGSAKCVRLSRQNLLENTASISAYLNITADDHAALILPLHYCYGLSVLNTHLAAGAAVHIGDISVASSQFLTLLQQQKITSFAGVPITFDILERIKFTDQQYPSLRYITQAGGKLGQNTLKKYAQWAQDNGKQFFVMYGQTEATARMAYVPPEKLLTHPNCIGIAVAGGKFSLKDESGATITTVDTPAELIYQGPNVMMGYAQCIADLSGGQQVKALHTGDIACVNRDNLYYIVGRKNRIAKIQGKRLSLDDIERFLDEHHYQAWCCSDDHTLFINYQACENTNNHGCKSTQAIKRLINQRYPIGENNITPISLEHIPQLSSGKIDYKTLLINARQHQQNLAAQHHSNSDRADQNDTSANKKAALLQAYASTFTTLAVHEHDSFTTLGGDSITYIQISCDIERILGDIPSNWENKSIKELATIATGKQTGLLNHEPMRNSTHTSGLMNKGTMETSILVRVYAILAVVLNHSGLTFLEGGSSLLLVSAGFMFGRFQWQTLLENAWFKFFISLLTHVLIPYWIVLTGYGLLRNGEVLMPHITLVGNLWPGSEKAPFGAWFIQALIHSLLICLLPLLNTRFRTWVGANKIVYAVSLLVLAVALRLIDGHYQWGENNGLHGFQTSWVFWLFVMGFLINAAVTRNSKMATAIAIMLITGLCYANDLSRLFTVLAGSLILLFSSRVTLPQWAIRSASIIASSSLFIYLLNERAPIDTFTAGYPLDIIRILSGVLMGIIGWKIYGLVLPVIQNTTARLSRWLIDNGNKVNG